MAEAELLDVMNTDQVPAGLQAHLRQCPKCASQLAALRQTSSLLDAWSVPEPSLYFDTRLHARMRELQSASADLNYGWLGWLKARARWQPALVGALAVALAVGIGLQRSGLILSHPDTEITDVVAPPGTAAGDLQALDKNFEVYANFDMLYEGNDEQDSQ
jgi:anti-sigma factor RsiW